MPSLSASSELLSRLLVRALFVRLGLGVLPIMGDFEVLTVSRDLRTVVSSVSDDVEGVTRRVESGGVPTIVVMDGIMKMGRSGGVCIVFGCLDRFE